MCGGRGNNANQVTKFARAYYTMLCVCVRQLQCDARGRRRSTTTTIDFLSSPTTTKTKTSLADYKDARRPFNIGMRHPSRADRAEGGNLITIYTILL